MTDILNTGKSALFAFQRALSTTSHNIANVNTEGYSRQRVSLEAVSGHTRNFHEFGAGVRVEDIQRVHDQFATARVNAATSAHTEQQTHHAMASRLDNLVASDGVSVSPAINEFFNSLQDANADPSSVAAREVVLERTGQLAQRFRGLQDQFEDAQSEVNERTRAAVDEVGQLAESIAGINRRVVSVTGTVNAHAASDLLDQRDKLVQQLSEYIDVSTVEQDNGALNVFMAKGTSLVIDGSAQRLRAVADDVYPDRLQIQIGREGFEQNLSTSVQGGEIGGLHEFVNQTLHPAMAELGRLALTLADNLNLQHSRGLDLEGNAGGQLFEMAAPQVLPARSNSGTGVLSATIDDTGTLEASDYVLRFDGANYTATRSSDGVRTSGPMPLSLDGMTLDLTGTPAAGDVFVVSATGRAAGSMNSLVSDAGKLALSGQLSTRSDIGNTGESRISSARILDPQATALTDPVDIVFTSATSYDLVDANSGATVSTGGSYTAGQPIQFNGWEVSISGTAHGGDTHRIEGNTHAQGNNSNGLRLVDMQQELFVDGTQSFNDAYGTLVSRVGAQTHSAQTRADALSSLRDSAISRQQATQGVSLDEEAVDLTRFQQAYQASAQIISTADTMFQSILGAIR